MLERGEENQDSGHVDSRWMELSYYGMYAFVRWEVLPFSLHFPVVRYLVPASLGTVVSKAPCQACVGCPWGPLLPESEYSTTSIL